MRLPGSLLIGCRLSLLPEFLHERHLVSVLDAVAKQQKKQSVAPAGQVTAIIVPEPRV